MAKSVTCGACLDSRLTAMQTRSNDASVGPVSFGIGCPERPGFGAPKASLRAEIKEAYTREPTNERTAFISAICESARHSIWYGDN